MMVAVLSEERESSWVLNEMEFVVYRSCLQKTKDVVFEGFSGEGLVMEVEVENEEEDEGEQERM